MADQTGARPPELKELPQIKDRLSFIYLEKCKLSQDGSALRADNQDGFILIPSHAFLILLLGPGVSITHKAAQLLGNSGTAILWTGESGTRFYGYGKSLSNSSALLIKQAKIVSTPKLHIEAVKRMYGLRFPEEDLTGLTLQQLRGKEGARMRKEYARQSKLWNVPWTGRKYDPLNFHGGDPINRALSVANTCLYGLAYAVICGLGLSPGLGLIHIGLQQSLVYDLADLYKAEITIPLCFELVSQKSDGIESAIRRELRDRLKNSSIIQRMVNDILYVFDFEFENLEDDILVLWDGIRDGVQSGMLYGKLRTDRENLT